MLMRQNVNNGVKKYSPAHKAVRESDYNLVRKKILFDV